ncbi:MAG: glutaredoxin family protein [Acidobacteriota bacterium]
MKRLALFAFALFALLLPSFAGADWLVTQDDRLITIQGSWSIDGDTVAYTEEDGTEQTMPLAQVNLDASKMATDMGNRITMYATSWCGFCERTREFMAQIGVPFVEKDIEADPSAFAEFNAKVGKSGVPVLDIDGQLVRGFRPADIRRHVLDLKARIESEHKAAR